MVEAALHSNRPPLSVMPFPAPPRAAALVTRRVAPEATVVPPVYEFVVLERVRTPAPSIVKPAEPAIGALIVSPVTNTRGEPVLDLITSMVAAPFNVIEFVPAMVYS